jgi:hypothetical protein
MRTSSFETASASQGTAFVAIERTTPSTAYNYDMRRRLDADIA